MIGELPYTEAEILHFADESGMIDMSEVLREMTMSKRTELLRKNPWEPFSGKTDGKWYGYVPDNTKRDGRRKIKKSTKEAVEDEIILYWLEQAYNPTIADVYHECIAEKLSYNEIEKGSADRYDTDFERFFVKSGFAKKKIKQVTEEELTAFIKRQIADNQLTSKSYSGLRIVINCIWIYAKEHKLTEISISNFFGDLRISKNSFRKTVKEKEDEVFCESEIPIIVNYIHEHETIWSLGVLLVLQTGVRVGELSALKPEDWCGNILKIRRTEVREKDSSGKNIVYVRDFTKTESGMREILLSGGGISTLEKIIKINPNGEYLFQNPSGKRIRGNTFNKSLDGILDKTGLHHRSIHKCRKTYAAMLINAGCDDAVVMSQLGHSSIDTTRKYYYYSNRTSECQIEQVQRAIPF